MWSIVHKEYRQRDRGVATVGLIITYTVILGGVSSLSISLPIRAGSAAPRLPPSAEHVHATFIAQMMPR